jgi:hypothetical protein
MYPTPAVGVDDVVDAILGLCWMREDNTRRFIAGSGNGVVKLCEYDAPSAGKASGPNISGASPAHPCACFSVHAAPTGAKNRLFLLDSEVSWTTLLAPACQ